MGKLTPELEAKYPKLRVIEMSGIGTVECSITENLCTQLERGYPWASYADAKITVTRVPEKPDAVGCAECPVYLAQKS